MTKTKSTRSALVSSVLALLLCFSMLLGTTFAWFTDSVTSANNVIKSGNLDIALDYWDGDSWETVEGTNSLFTNNLWEPGHTEVVYLKLSNLGSLALKYQLAIGVLSETEGTNMAGDPFKLSDYIRMGVVEGVNGQDAPYATREAAVDAVKDASGIIGAGYAKQGNMLAGAAELCMAVVVYMPETVGNEANAKTGTPAPTINLGLRVLATQYTAEGDSFGDQYDKEAWVSGMAVYTAEDLQAAINAGETNIKLMGDITLDEAIVIPASATTSSMRSATPGTVIDLNGKTITGTKGRDADGNRVHVIVNNGNAVIKNGVITSAGVNGGSAIYNADGATLTVENVTLNGAPQEGSTWPSYTVNNYGTLTVSDSSIYGVQGIIATNNTANTTVNNVIAYRDGWSSGHVFYNSSTAKVTINGGTYTNDGNGVDGTMIYGGETVVNGGTFIVKEGAYFALCSGSKLTVNGGDFSNIKSCLAWGGAMTISGGTFGFNPSTYVADGFKAVENNGAYYVVANDITGVITTADDLVALGGTKINGTYMLMADLDMTGKTMKPMEVSGGASVNFIGNGHTVSDLTLNAAGIHGMTGAGNEVAGLFDLSAPATTVSLTVSDLAFENATVACSGYAAVIAGYNPNGGTVITLNNVDVAGATVTSDSVAALVGYTTGSLVMTDCDVSGLALTGEAGRPEKVGAYVGTVNTATGAATVTNCTNATTYGDFGRVINGATWNGIVPVTTTAQLLDAIKNAPVGETTTIYLADKYFDGDIAITVANLGASGGDVIIKAMDGAKPVITGTVTLGYRNQGVGATMYNANVTFEGITFDHAAVAHSLDIQDVKSLTLRNCTVIGESEHGIVCARGNGTGTSTIVGCTFENAGLQLLGNYATGLVIDDCDFNDSCINVQAGNGVTVQNCKFNSTLTDANVGNSFYLIRSNSTPITVKNCEINIDSTVTGVATAQAKWGIFWNRGTTNWTVYSDVTVSLTEAAQAQTELLVNKCTSTGAINYVD